MTWQPAMEEETITLEKNHAWELVPRSRDVKSIFCRWIYKIKCILDGLIVRYKAQTVDLRLSQEYELHYDETFSPVAKITIVQVPPALVVNKDWKLWQVDMKKAFLHGELDGEIYMNQPNGFEHEVRDISQYRQNPKKLHLDVAGRTLRHVKGTIKYNYLYKRSKDHKLARYHDVDYAGYRGTRRSSIGYIFKLSSRIISWCAKGNQQYHCQLEKQSIAAGAAQKSLWLKFLMED